MQVLVTGAAGAIGIPACAALSARGHRVRAFDRLPTPGVADARVGKIEDAQAVASACAEVDAIVHLAATTDDAPFLELLPPNVIGLFNVLDSARTQGIRRVVLASSVQVLPWFDHRQQPSGEPTPAPVRRSGEHAAPRNHYALTKLWAERMGEMYAHTYDMSVIAARIGWMVRNEAEASAISKRGYFHSYVSRRDVADFLVLAVEASSVDFAVLYAVGPDGQDMFDLDAPRKLLGYQPQDAWPNGLPFFWPNAQRG